MKKSLVTLLTLTMLISVTACGNENSSDSIQQSSFNNGASATIEKTNDSAISEEDSVSSAENNDTESENVLNSSEEKSSHILVTYFSRVGNTQWSDDVDVVTSASLNLENGEYVGNAEYLAKMAQQATGGDIFLIQASEAYPSDYRDTTDKAKDEQNDNARPEISSHVENMDDYDTVILIYPNWWGTLPQPVFTFLEEYDFSGKTILPLCTHEGSRMGSSESDISALCPNAVLLEGLSVRGSDAVSAQSDVEAWINNSGILNY